MKGKYLETMTWAEANRELREIKSIVIPLGARTKEHGLHLPLNNDWIIAEYLTRRVLEVSNVIAVPTVQYGYYPAFLEYPGSISIGQDTCRDVILGICKSLHSQAEHLNFYVLNTGISTVRALEPARVILAQLGIEMHFSNLEQIAAELKRSMTTQKIGTHADELETSMMLYIAPEQVRMNLAEKDEHPIRGSGGLTRDPDSAHGVFSPTGAWGDPTLATVEKGRALVEATVAYHVGFLNRLDRGLTAQSPTEALI